MKYQVNYTNTKTRSNYSEQFATLKEAERAAWFEQMSCSYVVATITKVK